ncbi:carbohydrate ABC transporter permease [Lacticaseibacillus jixiensis]|uniref:carbohydrate ABC transporter permease n=1 Tax=Lacticaseibacillus jixiensis TaxID=3231926 RepID=UPI0036F3D651
MQRTKTIKEGFGSRTFDVVNALFMAFLMIVCFYPIWYVVMASVSNSADVTRSGGIIFWPHSFNLGAYTQALTHPLIASGFRNIFIILLLALPLNIVMTLLCGYFMSAKNVMFKKYIVGFIMVTMFFSGGLIPSYLNMKSLGLYDNLWALIIPGALSVYNAIICKSAIDAIPESLFESARMDGATDFTILFKIVTPLIKPTLAVLLLYYGVGHWNSWFGASIYIKDNTLLPIQNVLRAVLLANTDTLSQGASSDTVNNFAESIKYAAIVLSTIPILCIYPFVQKYFVKGVMIGSVKG